MCYITALQPALVIMIFIESPASTSCNNDHVLPLLCFTAEGYTLSVSVSHINTHLSTQLFVITQSFIKTVILV